MPQVLQYVNFPRQVGNTEEIRPIVLLGKERVQGQADDRQGNDSEQECTAMLAQLGEAARQASTRIALQPEEDRQA